ncbi:YveK family protein [Garciella nitratireducens]|uniref:YveK family protein n=1 Tax=Garciella nitratireducens TaxID=218205 RepID=UPI001BD4FE2C|nr:Wzz/FepE/Etk N-terminal domain-containing protein [Garciella nitratireducens]
MEFEEEIDLREILHLLKKQWRMIASITLIAIIMSAIISIFILNPVYQATSTILVGRNQENHSQTEDLYSDVTLSKQLVNTYGEIIKTSAVLDPVIHNLKLDTTIDQLSEKITVTPVGETELIQVTVQDRYPMKAADISNEICEVFSDKIQEIMKVDNVSIIEQAVAPTTPVKPNKMLNIAIGGVLGLMVSIFIVFLKEYLDNTIKTPEDVQKYLELPVLGTIPMQE